MERVEGLIRKLAEERDTLSKRVAELEVQNKSIKKEMERLSDGLHDAEGRASDAEKRCAAEWEKDCADALRSLAEETNFQWDPDGDPADNIREHIQLTLEEYDGAVYRLRAEVARLREALKAIHKGACLTAQESRSWVDDRHCLADVIRVANEALSSTNTSEWLAARDAEQRRIGAAEWLEKEAAENLERFGTHFYESTTDSMLAEAARLREALETLNHAAKFAISREYGSSFDEEAPLVIRLLDGTCDATDAVLAATPAQSLAAHDAALLERVKARLYALASKEADQPYGHEMNPRQWAATCLECAAEDVTAMQEEIQSEADRIEKEAE